MMQTNAESGPRILYVEDEGFQVRGTIDRALEIELGASVTLARSVAEARKRLQTEDFDVVILDIMMDPLHPVTVGGSSLALLDDLRGECGAEAPASRIPIVFATAVWDLPLPVPTTGGKMQRATVGSYVADRLGDEEPIRVEKPFTGTELVKAVRKVLDRQE